MNNGTLAPFVVRWWWVLLLSALLSACVGFGAATLLTKTYEAETQMLVGPLNTTFDLDASGTLARTYAQLGEGRPVLAHAIRETGAKLTPAELDENSSIESNEITRIVTVRVQGSDPTQAARLSDGIADRLVEMSSERRARASSGLDAFGREPEIVALEESARDPILAAAERVFSGSIAGRLHITESAEVPGKPVRPSVPLIVVLSALGGLLLAAAAGLVYESSSGEPTPSVTPASPFVAPRAPNGGEQVDAPARDRWGALISDPGHELHAGDG